MDINHFKPIHPTTHLKIRSDLVYTYNVILLFCFIYINKTQYYQTFDPAFELGYLYAADSNTKLLYNRLSIRKAIVLKRQPTRVLCYGIIFYDDVLHIPIRRYRIVGNYIILLLCVIQLWFSKCLFLVRQQHNILYSLSLCFLPSI